MRNERFKLSSQQIKAVDIGKNVAVSAGAGSGKTRVLTSRYLKLLESGCEIEEIAAITFTEKAALEMKERIRKAIISKISLSHGNEKGNWMRQLDKLSRANINTIHGFCSNIVKENAAYLGIDFKFEIINEIDKALILRDACDAAMEGILSNEEYCSTLQKLQDIYGDSYITSTFKREILEVRDDVLNQGERIEDLYKDADCGSIEGLIFKMALKIDEYYFEYKINHNLLDYNDLETMALKILENNRLRERYRKRYKTLLVDEFQDTNEIQRKIIYLIAGDDNGNLVPSRLFIVGDFKQSIYGFRGTDYRIFKRVSEDIGPEGKVSLSTCYRSKNEIIEGVNSIFKELIENYEPLECPYDSPIYEKRIKLITYKKEKETTGKILTDVKNILQNKPSSFRNPDEAFEALKDSYCKFYPSKNKEGIAVSKAIEILMEKGLNFGDISILVRSRNAIPKIEDELKRKNVPYCIIGGSGFYQKPEVEEVLNLYRVIIRGFEGEFTYDDNLSFIMMLRGALFEIPDKIILDIRVQRDECYLENYFKAISYVIDGMDESENRMKLQRLYDTLIRLNMLKKRLSVVQMLKWIIKECRVYEIMLSQEDGIQKYRNIEKLMHVAQEFDRQELFTPEQFLEYINLLMENSMDDSEAALDTEDSDAVKIMTIHQSKGLEFKGVIIPKIHSDLLSISKNHKNQIVYSNGSIIFSKDIETGEDNAIYSTYISERLSNEIDEYIRLLYVAMTRAEDYVILTGEDDGKLPEDFTTDEGKIKNLNSFLKQIKYAINVKGGDKGIVEFLDFEDLPELKPVNNPTGSMQIDEDDVDKRLKYRSIVKPGARISPSSYMKYEKCPRKYYIENVLKLSESNYSNVEFADEITVNGNTLNAARLGTIVHSIIEELNCGMNISEEEAINNAVKYSNVNGMEGIKDILKRYIDNYLILDNNRRLPGNRIYISNELEYNLAPFEDNKLSIVGYIDRLEVFEDNNRLIAVITDYKTNKLYNDTRKKELINTYELQLQLYGKAIRELLYINGIKVKDIILQIYFISSCESIEIQYDEDRVETQLKLMDNIFTRNLNEYNAGDYPKKNGKCGNCEYNYLCNK